MVYAYVVYLMLSHPAHACQLPSNLRAHVQDRKIMTNENDTTHIAYTFIYILWQTVRM